MKFFLSSDIEGTNGICDWEETKYAKQGWETFSEKMTKEVQAVCKGLNKVAPGCRITVKDAHDTGRNIDHSQLPLNVSLCRGWGSSPLSMMFGLDDTYDAALFTGYHSPAGRGANPLAHTMSGDISWITINETLASEFLINYYTALYLGVPVVLLSGDEGLCASARDIDPEIMTVATGCGVGGSMTSPHPEATLAALEEAASRVTEQKTRVSLDLPATFHVNIRYRAHQQATRGSYYPGANRIDDHTLSFETNDYMNFLKFLMFV